MRLLLTFIFSYIIQCSILSAQVEANIKCENTKMLNDIFESLSINGMIIRFDSVSKKILLNNEGFDTINFIIRHSKDTVSCLTKMKEGETYIFKPNPCAGYLNEFFPMNNGSLGLLRFDKISKNDTLYGFLDGFSDTITNIKETRYLHSQASGMCFFNSKLIRLAKNISEGINRRPEDVITKINFYFLHGELLLAKINVNKKTIDLSITGYIKEGETFDKYIND